MLKVTNRVGNTHRHHRNIVRGPHGADMVGIVCQETFRSSSPEITGSGTGTIGDTIVCPSGAAGGGITELKAIVEIVGGGVVS